MHVSRAITNQHTGVTQKSHPSRLKPRRRHEIPRISLHHRQPRIIEGRQLRHVDASDIIPTVERAPFDDQPVDLIAALPMAGNPFRGDTARYEVSQGAAGLIHPSPPVARDVKDQMVAEDGGRVEAAGGAEAG